MTVPAAAVLGRTAVVPGGPGRRRLVRFGHPAGLATTVRLVPGPGGDRGDPGVLGAAVVPVGGAAVAVPRRLARPVGDLGVTVGPGGTGGARGLGLRLRLAALPLPGQVGHRPPVQVVVAPVRLVVVMLLGGRLATPARRLLVVVVPGPPEVRPVGAGGGER
ncbi:hypothetical protein ACSNN7_26510, partial [Micromonospora sp. URMC 105]